MLGAIPYARMDPARPVCHFRAPAQWMNDPNGTLYHDGWHHVFYQLHPFSDQSGPKYWGHARTRDLVRWEHLPIALAPSVDAGESECWSGCATIRPDGTPMIFYTSIGPERCPLDSAEQWAALGCGDLTRWRKHPANPILTASLHGKREILDWRDPFVFHEDGRWFLVLGGHRKGGRGCVNLYSSDDLERWHYVSIALEGEEENWECPNLVCLGDLWALLYSPHSIVKYYTGKLDLERGRFVPVHHGIVDHGVFYASNISTDPSERHILWGWQRTAFRGRGWNGCLALPRVLGLKPDGSLTQQVAPELVALRREQVHLDHATFNAAGLHVKHCGGECLEILLRVGLGDASGFTLAVGSAVIRWHDGVLDASGVYVPVPLPRHGEPLELRVFLDRSLLEVFADTGACASQWVDYREPYREVVLWTTRGGAELLSIDVWRLEPVWIA